MRLTSHWWAILALASACQQPPPQPAPPTVVTTPAPAPPFPSDAAERFQSYFDSLHTATGFSGCACLASGSAEWHYCVGSKSAQGEPLAPTDAFQLASASKPFTALAIQLLEQRGLVNLSDSLGRYLSAGKHGGVTLYQLLTHTSGIGYYAYVSDGLWPAKDQHMSNDDLLQMMACEQVPTYLPAGSRFDYCNTNYALLASVVEVVSGLDFGTFLKRNIFDPAGMHHTFVLNTNCQWPRSHAVVGNASGQWLGDVCYLDGVVGDKGLYSTTADLLRFQRSYFGGLFGGEIPAQASALAASTSDDAFYGLGWRLVPTASDTTVYHNGWWRGFKSYFQYEKCSGRSIVVLSNTADVGMLPRQRLWRLFEEG